MKPSAIDVRRYAWCHSQALWIMGMPVAAFLEDMHGALEADQVGLLRYAARGIGEACAVALALAVRHARPIPTAHMRGTWALDWLEGHELRGECWDLMKGGDEDPSALLEQAEHLVGEVRTHVGHAPDILTPEGYYPALALARDWLKLLAVVDEEEFLPHQWIEH